jgi:hypothetical protein
MSTVIKRTSYQNTRKKKISKLNRVHSIGKVSGGRVHSPKFVQVRPLPKWETVETFTHSLCRNQHPNPNQTTLPTIRRETGPFWEHQ